MSTSLFAGGQEEARAFFFFDFRIASAFPGDGGAPLVQGQGLGPAIPRPHVSNCSESDMPGPLLGPPSSLAVTVGRNVITPVPHVNPNRTIQSERTNERTLFTITAPSRKSHGAPSAQSRRRTAQHLILNAPRRDARPRAHVTSQILIPGTCMPGKMRPRRAP